MPVILLEKDPFVQEAVEANREHNNTDVCIRRPLMGVMRKPNTFAYISIYAVTGTGTLAPISILDSSGPSGSPNKGGPSVERHGYSNANHNFVLQQVQMQRQEKTQIIETFGDEYAFFYGETAQIVSFQGMLLNTSDFNWKNEWLRNYDKFLRGTRCVEMKARVYVGFDDVVCSGYITATQVQLVQDNQFLCPFSFQMLLTGYQDLSIGNGSYVNSMDDARKYGDQGYLGPYGLSNTHAEYMRTVGLETGGDTPVSLWEYSPKDGEPKEMTGDFKAPSTIEYERTAAWLGAPNNPLKQQHTPAEGLKEISIQRYMQENSVDRTTAILAYARNSSSLSLNNRDDNSSGIETALGSGIGNFCGVVADEFTGT
jgi:hypothetical protein